MQTRQCFGSLVGRQANGISLCYPSGIDLYKASVDLSQASGNPEWRWHRARRLKTVEGKIDYPRALHNFIQHPDVIECQGTSIARRATHLGPSPDAIAPILAGPYWASVRAARNDVLNLVLKRGWGAKELLQLAKEHNIQGIRNYPSELAYYENLLAIYKEELSDAS
jgi:hypothetical protein